MKNLLILSLVAISLTSCLKNRLKKDQSALTNYKIETAFDEMTNISDQAITGNMVYYKSGQVIVAKPGQNIAFEKTDCNVIITIDTTSSPKSVTVDYGTSNCTCNDGKTRRGKIITTFTGQYIAPGTIITHTPVDYYVNDVKYEGTKTVQNMGTNANGQPYFNVQIDGVATMETNEVVNYTSTRVRTWTTGFNTLLNRFDDEYDITGTSEATFSSGDGYTGNTTSPIHIKVGCGFPVSGTLDITPTGKPVRQINYGDGTCDYSFTVTVSGYTFTIN
jgi:hypothetical protein